MDLALEGIKVIRPNISLVKKVNAEPYILQEPLAFDGTKAYPVAMKQERLAFHKALFSKAEDLIHHDIDGRSKRGVCTQTTCSVVSGITYFYCLYLIDMSLKYN